MRPAFTILAALWALAPASLARAQELRMLHTARQLVDSQPLSVDVAFGAGKFTLYPIEGRLLYEMRLRYDEGATDAVHEYDAENRSLRLGLDRRSASFGIRALRGGSHKKSSELNVGLGNTMPMELSISVAGTESTLELGGLRLTRLLVNCAASGMTLNFGVPNRVAMETLTLKIAAAGAKIQNLGNANASTVMIKGAAGGLRLDFGDAVMRDMTVRTELALGSLEIALPRSVGIMVRAKSRLGGFDGGGLNKVGDAWYSENWNQATRKVTIESTTFLGGFALSRSGH